MTAAAAVAASRVSAVMARCNRRGWNGERLCTRQADVRLTGMCVHEHLNGPTPYCAEHAEFARGRNLACPECRDSSESHNCRVAVVREEPLGGAA